MFGNPLDKINQQIAELERIKQSYSVQQPIQNIINTQTYPQSDFEARFTKENENPEEIIIQKKTAFIDLKNGVLSIKELDGNIAKYELIKPKTEEQLRIEELERKLAEYESKFNSTNNEISEQRAINITNDESSAKTSGRGISKKS